jgi:septum formation protein
MSKKILILASSSKRRLSILKDCGIEHEAVVSGAKELLSEKYSIPQLVQINARLKAQKVSRIVDEGIVLGVDTLVLLGKSIIGKPRNKKQARLLLQRFSGRKIEVYTGLHVIDKYRHKSVSGYEKTSLWVKKIPRDQIDKYLKHLGPFDKAGGFSIEGVGSVIFDNIHGSYFNILGLPTGKLSELFEKINLDIFDFMT